MEKIYYVQTVLLSDKFSEVRYSSLSNISLVLTTDYDYVAVELIHSPAHSIYEYLELFPGDVIKAVSPKKLVIKASGNYFERDFSRFNKLVFGIDKTKDFIFDTQSLNRIKKEQDDERRLHNRASEGFY